MHFIVRKPAIVHLCLKMLITTNYANLKIVQKMLTFLKFKLRSLY